MSIEKASISIQNVQSITNTINANKSSITSLSDASSFASNVTSPISSTVGDPIASVLNKTLSKISNTTVLTERKINDLITQIESSSDNTTTVTVVNNSVVITVNEADEQKAELKKAKIENQISSIKNTLNILQSTINTLQNITSTVSILQGLLTAQEAILTMNPISGATFKVLKKGVKILFLRDMLSTYSKVISNQLSQSQIQFNQMLARFMNLQVSINVKENKSQGNNITPDQASVNISQQILNDNNEVDVDNQSNTFLGSNGKVYILTVDQYGPNQLIGKAIEQTSGMLSVQTAPSYIKSPDQLMDELKSILNS
jgi:hypothetical protein